MTDTDKLKRLAENMIGQHSEFWPTAKAKSEFSLLAPEAILALIAENERLRADFSKFADALEAGEGDDVASALNQRICCSGHECGCMGSSVGSYLAYCARQILSHIDADNNTMA